MEKNIKLQGKILNWNDEKGFGFVEANGGGDRAFVHIKAFKPNSRRPIDGDIIIYQLTRQKDGRFKARNIQFARNDGKPNRPTGYKNSGKLGTYLVLVFWSLLLGSILSGKTPLIIAGLYIVASLITFFAYAVDKSAAQAGRWRTQETTLHGLSLIGGWPGAFFAQKKLRHKSSKTGFREVYTATVLLNLGTLIWLHTENGMKILNLVLNIQ